MRSAVLGIPSTDALRQDVVELVAQKIPSIQSKVALVVDLAPRSVHGHRADLVSRSDEPLQQAGHVEPVTALLLDARERFRTGAIDAAALRAVEDDAIRGVVKLQEDLGLRGITDGEYRRTYFHIDFLTQLQGVQTKGGIHVKFHSAKGDVDFEPPVMQVTGKVGHAKPIQRADFEFLRSVTSRTPKVTIPSPTMLHFRGGRDAISRDAYPDLEAFYRDVAAGYADELSSLGEAGCTYVQFDDTNLAYLCDERMREGARQRGDDPRHGRETIGRLVKLIDRCAGASHFARATGARI